MPSKKSPSPSTKAVVITMMIALLGVGVFATYVNMTPAAARVSDDLRAKPAVSIPSPTITVEGSTKPPKVDNKQDLMVPAIQGEDVQLGPKLGTMAAGVDPKAFLITETFSSMGISGGRAV